MRKLLLHVVLLAVVTSAGLAAQQPAGQTGLPGNSPSPGFITSRSVPEPATMLLIGAGIAVAVGVRKYRSHRR